MSLQRPHPIYQTCGNNSYELCKSIVQLRMISGRYRTDKLVRHFSPESDGNCSLCQDNTPGSIEHLLTQCAALSDTRRQLLEKLDSYNISETSKSLIITSINSTNTEEVVQFLLDCSVNAQVISETQLSGPGILEELFRFTRSWCYAVHRSRLKLQGRWTNT